MCANADANAITSYQWSDICTQLVYLISRTNRFDNKSKFLDLNERGAWLLSIQISASAMSEADPPSRPSRPPKLSHSLSFRTNSSIILYLINNQPITLDQIHEGGWVVRCAVSLTCRFKSLDVYSIAVLIAGFKCCFREDWPLTLTRVSSKGKWGQMIVAINTGNF